MIYLLIVTLLVVIATITYGFVQRAKEELDGNKKIRKALKINMASFLPVVTFAIIMLIPNIVSAAADSAATSTAGLGYIAAAISTAGGAIGAGIAVGSVGSSALGAVSEDPKILGKTLIFVGLAEGIAIYGLIIALMILAKLG